MKFNYNFEEPSNIQTFGDLKNALKERFDELFSKGYLYKGDMGETPQIVNRPLVEKVDGVEKWSALGRSIIKAIFKDTKYYKYYEKKQNIDIDTFIDTILIADHKLEGLNSTKSSATYPWWCADGNSKYPIYPATYFVYIDSTPNDIRNNAEFWEDNSCILIPEEVVYSDYSDEATTEELEPMITYHKNHIYPTFYFDSEAASAGAWCWEINGVKTGVPASVANDDGSVLGHMFIFEKRKKEDEEGKWIYYYKAGVNSNADDDWMTMEEMKKANLRYPIKGDIGFTIEEVAKKDEGTDAGSTPTVTNINTLQIYNFVEDDNDPDNGGEWGLGGNLISFGESFYKALWEFISGDSGIEINKGKIILGTTNGNHCIFVKKDDSQTGRTLVLMPLDLGIDPTERDEFKDNEIWGDADLQLNYPKTTINGEVEIKSNLEVSDRIKASSIEVAGDITARTNISVSGDISAENSITCNKFTTNDFAVNDKDRDVFTIRDNSIDTNLPVNISISSKKYIKISNSPVLTEQTQLNPVSSEIESTSETIIRGGENIKPTARSEYDAGPTKKCNIEITYGQNADGPVFKYDLPGNMTSITLSMPYSLGISINVYGKNKNGSWPRLESGSMTLRLFAKRNDGGPDYQLCEHPAHISENNSVWFSTNLETRYCTIYCSFTPDELKKASSTLVNNKSYKSIYITAEATFNLKTNSASLGQKATIYKAGTEYGICSRPAEIDGDGASEWSETNPASSMAGQYIILKTDTKTQTDSSDISSGGIETVHICPDGILIGKARNNSAVLRVDKDGFHIEYYIPETNKPHEVTKTINILSISTAGICESDVFQLKQSTTASSTES